MKIVILTFDLPEANVVTRALLREPGGAVRGIVASTSMITGISNRAAIVRLGRALGWRYGGAWQLHRWLAKLGALNLRLRRKPAGVGSLKALAREAGIPVFETPDARDEGCLATVRSWAPDLIVSNHFNQVIRRPMLEIPPKGTINMHPALLPRNRGLSPCFWAMANGDAATGATIHLQGAVPIEPGESVISLSHKCSDSGADLLLDCIAGLRNGRMPGAPQDETKRSYHSWPSPGGIRRLYRRGYRYGSIGEMWRQVGRVERQVQEP